MTRTITLRRLLWSLPAELFTFIVLYWVTNDFKFSLTWVVAIILGKFLAFFLCAEAE
jgi:hypothetical protein